MSANITKTKLPPSQAYENTKERLQQVKDQMGSINGTAMASAFSADVVPQAPEDPMFGLMAAYKRDTDSKKVDLGIGAYRDNNGKPWILPVVKQARCLHSMTLRLLVMADTLRIGRRHRSQGSRAEPRIPPNCWSCRLHFRVSEAGLRR